MSSRLTDAGKRRADSPTDLNKRRRIPKTDEAIAAKKKKKQAEADEEGIAGVVQVDHN